MGQVQRRKFLLTAGVLLVAPLAATAQQPPTKTARVGYLSPGDRYPVGGPGSRGWLLNVFMEGLRAHGWAEGQNLVIEYRFGGERYERLRALADELVRLKVDVIFAAGAPAAQAAKEATSTIPVVFSTLNDPVRAGFVTSFAHPGGNMTGQAGFGPELDRKRVELLKEVVPSISRAAVLVNPSNPMTPQRLTEVEATARDLKVQVGWMKASDAKELEEAFQAIVRARPAGLIVFEDPMLIANRRRIVAFAAQQRIATIYTSSGWAEAGGLMEHAPNWRDMYLRAAAYVDRILRGAKPSELPVEQPTKFELVINLKTAKALGLSIPKTVLFRADRVIE